MQQIIVENAALEAGTACLDSRAVHYPDFYYMRHGMTDANLKQTMCGGGWDLGLNAAGLSQAFTAAYGPLGKCSELRTICVSPMKRARQTANIISSVLKLPIVVVDGLREIMVGDWEQQPWHAIPDPFVVSCDPPGGETIAAFERRVAQALAQALLNPGPVLVVAHGGVWFALAKRLGIGAQIIENCTVQKVSHNKTKGSWQSEYIC